MSELSARLSGFSAVSIIGLCKNAGKTTAFNHIIEELGKGGTALGLTSIGRDGESVDLVTGTEKPGIYVREGAIIATAQGLLRHCDITREIVDNTQISTPLGDVIIVRALSDGNVQLAGPSIVSQLADIKRRFFALGAQKVIIDGAISRKTLCSRELCEAVVLCVGASCGRDMMRVTGDARHICRVLTLPEISSSVLDSAIDANPGARVTLPDMRTVFIPGAMSDALMRPLATSGEEIKGITFVARDSSKVMISAETMEKLEIRGARVAVLESVELAAVTVNPFSAYGYHFDAREFKAAMERAVSAPVFDIRTDFAG